MAPASSVRFSLNTVAMPTAATSRASTASTTSGLSDRSRSSCRSYQLTVRPYRIASPGRIGPANDAGVSLETYVRRRSRAADAAASPWQRPIAHRGDRCGHLDAGAQIAGRDRLPPPTHDRDEPGPVRPVEIRRVVDRITGANL